MPPSSWSLPWEELEGYLGEGKGIYDSPEGVAARCWTDVRVAEASQRALRNRPRQADTFISAATVAAAASTPLSGPASCPVSLARCARSPPRRQRRPACLLSSPWNTHVCVCLGGGGAEGGAGNGGGSISIQWKRTKLKRVLRSQLCFHHREVSISDGWWKHRWPLRHASVLFSFIVFEYCLHPASPAPAPTHTEFSLAVLKLSWA